MRRLLILLLGFWCASGFAAEKTFYQNFLAFIATNDVDWEIRSPLLVDTNNRAYKLENIVTNLAELKKTGTLGGVRPGMTMDEVVRCWGKPLEFWVRGSTGPRFAYKEVTVFFDPTTNSVKTVYTHNLPSVMRSLMTTPTVDQCVGALGNPSYENDMAEGGAAFLVYELPGATFKLGCAKGKLSSIQLDRPE